MKSYVAGFLFDKKEQRVVLIKKKHPEWQKGHLNAVGGKIEPGETPLMAMRREFWEEAGESIEDWKQFVRLGSPGAWEVFFFVAHGDVDKVRTCTDEEIEVHCTCLLEVLPVLPNLRWLIPMAMSLSHGESADSFEVQEIRSKQPE